MTTKRRDAIVNSALWAATGDALGWITELAGEGALENRAGVRSVVEPIEWRRMIGGSYGVQVALPAGTYSDDTQLRLAVCRSIRGNGVFDPEAFARVELTTWSGYSLGAGRGTKAAAANLAKRGVNWFSNFFEARGQRYVNAGGNGAAMRIQPHVWVARDGVGDRSFVLPVLRDSLITHGHPHGFCGAVFHALALNDALDRELVSGPERWREYLDFFEEIPAIISRDRQISEFWLPVWQQVSGEKIEDSIRRVQVELARDVDSIANLTDPESYLEILKRIGCLESKYRGSGLKTALAASALSWINRNVSIKETLARAANVLQSDTDTIATMVGAILGSVRKDKFDWPLQDREYIQKEAQRLAAIGQGELQDSFVYPDLARWQAPSTQSDAVGRTPDGLAVVGLGSVSPEGDDYVAGDAIWQWLRLSFGQTVFAKRRSIIKEFLNPELLPGERRLAQQVRSSNARRINEKNPGLPFMADGDQRNSRTSESRKTYRENEDDSYYQNKLGRPPERTIDYWSDIVIRSDFDDRILGELLNTCIDEYGAIEAAVAFAGIVAKAKLARRRKAKSR